MAAPPPTTDVNHQSCNDAKTNNIHCIIEANAAIDAENGNAHISQLHQADEICGSNVDGSAASDDDDDDDADDTHSDTHSADITTANNTNQQQPQNDTEMPATTVAITVPIEPAMDSGDTVATPITSTDTDSLADDGDITKKHTSKDGINGPANNVRV